MGKKKVVVGMSGGVDSSVAAWLLLKQGYQVLGVTMQIWQDEALEQMEENGGCCGLSAVDDARQAASHLGIAHYVMNFKKDFKEKVIDYFMDEYLCGRTPNPCIACNRYIKWETLLKRSSDIGADYIATGHYARIERLANGRYALRKSAASAKDQTYARFIEEHARVKIPEGNFVWTDGTVIGRHKGITHYTIGQRKGLGLAMGRPVVVTRICPEKNEVMIGEADAVFGRTLRANRLNWMSVEGLDGEARFLAKIRYNHAGAMCTVKMTGEDEAECIFDEPVRAVTPGQAVVFYDGDYVAGGGTIL